MTGPGYTTPLQPFPNTPSTLVPMGIAWTKLLTVAFGLIFVIWLIYTLVAAYHWFKYGHRSWVAIPALAVHVFVSLTVILFAASGLK